MRFYRLEKTNYITIWAGAILKSGLIALMLSVVLMLICGYKFMIVTSGSMEPTMPVGSMVIVTPCDYEDLKKGDIVTMQLGSGMNLTHRVEGKGILNEKGELTYVEEGHPDYESALWCTKGDNSDTHDGPISGEVVGVIHEDNIFEFTGDVVRYIKSNTMVVIIFAVLFVVFFEVLNYLKNKMVIEDIECYDWEEEE